MPRTRLSAHRWPCRRCEARACRRARRTPRTARARGRWPFRQHAVQAASFRHRRRTPASDFYRHGSLRKTRARPFRRRPRRTPHTARARGRWLFRHRAAVFLPFHRTFHTPASGVSHRCAPQTGDRTPRKTTTRTRTKKTRRTTRTTRTRRTKKTTRTRRAKKTTKPMKPMKPMKPTKKRTRQEAVHHRPQAVLQRKTIRSGQARESTSEQENGKDASRAKPPLICATDGTAHVQSTSKRRSRK